MKERRFRKSGPTWHRDQQELIQVVNIQKSQWGDQFYINLGIYLKKLGTETRPTHYRCHIRFRIDFLLAKEDLPTLNCLLNFDEPIPLVARYSELRQLIAQSALAWLDAHTTQEALAHTLRHDSAWRPRTDVAACEHLGIPTDF